jgi:hypothetical protein
LTEPLGDGTGVAEGIVLADLDLSKVVAARRFLVVVGHYSRPDLLWLGVDRRQREVVVAEPSKSRDTRTMRRPSNSYVTQEMEPAQSE